MSDSMPYGEYVLFGCTVVSAEDGHRSALVSRQLEKLGHGLHGMHSSANMAWVCFRESGLEHTLNIREMKAADSAGSVFRKIA